MFSIESSEDSLSPVSFVPDDDALVLEEAEKAAALGAEENVAPEDEAEEDEVAGAHAHDENKHEEEELPDTALTR
jgi:hypothetical protein